MHSRIKNMLSRPLNINNYTFFKPTEMQDARDLIPVDKGEDCKEEKWELSEIEA